MFVTLAVVRQKSKGEKIMKTRTPEERAALLVKAKILDENGNYHKDFFRPETVEKSKARKVNAGK
jgi:hypothetical protein